MLHHRREFDRERPRQLAHRSAVLALEPGEDRTSRRVDKRRESAVKRLMIVHHLVNYLVAIDSLSTPEEYVDLDQTLVHTD